MPEMMRAMVLERPGERLVLRELPVPQPGPAQLLLEISACGVCRTDLHVVDGELSEPVLPLIPGHQIVGRIVALGEGAGSRGFEPGQRVGVPWLGYSCGECGNCRAGRENLCDNARYTGYQLNGGFAGYCVADARFCFSLPEGYPDTQAAPLLCAGLIGFRAYRMALGMLDGQGREQPPGDGIRRLGLYGFGASAHILAQVARHDAREIYAFTSPGDASARQLAISLGAAWAGGSDEPPPAPLDAAIIFAPVGALVPAALKAVVKGGTVVCAGIHMSDIPRFPYAILWEERQLRSVANLTRRDGELFLKLAPRIPVRSEVRLYPLERTNEALDDLRAGRITGAAVVTVAE